MQPTYHSSLKRRQLFVRAILTAILCAVTYVVIELAQPWIILFLDNANAESLPLDRQILFWVNNIPFVGELIATYVRPLVSQYPLTSLASIGGIVFWLGLGRGSPRGMLRTALRVGGRDSELGQALLSAPPDLPSLHTADLAIAYCEYAILWPFSTFPESSEAKQRKSILPVVLKVVERLSSQPEQVLIALAELFRVAEEWGVNVSAHSFSMKAWYQIVRILVSGPVLKPAQLEEYLLRLHQIMNYSAGNDNNEALLKNAIAFQLLHIDDTQSFEKLLSSLAYRCREEPCLAFETLVATAIDETDYFEAHLNLSVLTPEHIADLALFEKQLNNDGRIEKLIDHLNMMTSDDNGKPQATLSLARTFSAASFANIDDASRCEHFAKHVDTIATSFPDHQWMQSERAQAWRYVVFANGDNPSRCEHFAKYVDTIAAPFPDHQGMQTERTKAWTRVATANIDDASRCEHFAKHVDTIAAPFPDHQKMQTERAEAWRNVASTYIPNPSDCEHFAKYVDAVAAPFPDDQEMQTERAVVWRFAAFANIDDASRCEHFAKHVDTISAQFPDNQGMQSERAQAWRYVVFSIRDNPSRFEHFAKQVDTIAAQFPDHQKMQTERAEVWRIVAINNDDNASRCEQFAKQVDTIAAPFPKHQKMQTERAAAWRGVVFANADNASDCEHFAKYVDAIAAPFPKHQKMQFERAQAWRYAAFANQKIQTKYNEALERIRNISLKFPENPDIQAEYSEAFSYRSSDLN